MAFKKKTWIDRMVEFAGRRKITNVSTSAAQIIDVERAEGAVSQEGDAFSAENMNDLEKRISDAFADVPSGYKIADNDTTNNSEFLATARVAYEHGLEIDALSRDLKVVKEHSVWEQIGTLSGTAQKIFDFSQREEICLVTTCAGNAKLVYTVKIPVVVLSEDKIHVCNGGYTAGTGAQCEWEISKTSCRLLACYVGGTNYTGSATTIYAR